MIAKVKNSVIPLLGTDCSFFGLTAYVKMFNFLQVQILDLCQGSCFYTIYFYFLWGNEGKYHRHNKPK